MLRVESLTSFHEDPPAEVAERAVAFLGEMRSRTVRHFDNRLIPGTVPWCPRTTTAQAIPFSYRAEGIFAGRCSRSSRMWSSVTPQQPPMTCAPISAQSCACS